MSKPLPRLLLLMAALCVASAWAKPPAAKAKPRSASEAMAAQVSRPGTWAWKPELGVSGPMLIVISLTEQRAHVYRGGTRIGLASISSGSVGRETPTGRFQILQKKPMHRSNLYDDAPMPLMQRLTWDGIALHVGANPGYPASHGCVRLPRGFAEKLYAATSLGTRVLITDELTDAPELVHPGAKAPVDAAGEGTWGEDVQTVLEGIRDADEPPRPLIRPVSRTTVTEPPPNPPPATPAPSPAPPYSAPPRDPAKVIPQPDPTKP